MGQSRNRISTTNQSFDESNQYTSPTRSQSQSTIQVNTTEVNRYSENQSLDRMSGVFLGNWSQSNS